MKKEYIIIILFLCLSCNLFQGCSVEGKIVMSEINQNVILYKDLTTTLHYDEVQNKLTEQLDLSVYCRLFHIETYKVIGDMKYTVINTTKGLAVVFFDPDGNNPYLRQITFSKNENEGAVSVLKENMTLHDVQQADPDGQFDFLYHSWSEFPQISYHFFPSGKCYMIHYQDNIITDIFALTI